MRQTSSKLPLGYLIAAFIGAAPLGFALGVAGMMVLPGDLSTRLFDSFLVLIALGALGVALFALPPEARSKPTAEPAAEPIASNVIRFRIPKHRPARPIVGRSSVVAVRRFSPRR